MQSKQPTDIEGLDISAVQGITDENKLFDGRVKFLYCRAYGKDHTAGGDVKFVDYVTRAKNHGVPVGGYYFATPFVDAIINTNAEITSLAETQAQQFIDKLYLAFGSGNTGDITPIVDVETYSDTITQHGHTATSIANYPRGSGMTGDQLILFIKSFRDYFWNVTGRRLGIYCDRYFMTGTVAQDGCMALTTAQLNEIADMPLWIANWDRWYGGSGSNVAPADLGGWTRWTAWQYEMIADASSYGLSHATNELDHDRVPHIAYLTKPPSIASDKWSITDNLNGSININVAHPSIVDVPDYKGCFVYVNGVKKIFIDKNTLNETVTGLTIGNNYNVQLYSNDLTNDETPNTAKNITLSSASVQPFVTIVSLSMNKLSDEEGFQNANLVFTFNTDIVEYTVRCGGNSYNTGIDCQSEIISVLANTEITANISYNELEFQGENQINIYGKDINGNWSSYEQDIEDIPILPVTSISPSQTVQNTTSITITLSATNSPTATYYKVGTGTQQTYTTPFIVNQSDSGVLSTNIQVTYWSVNVDGTESQKVITYDTSGAIPSMPVVTVTNGENVVTLDWAVTSNTTSYNIYRSTSSGTLGTMIKQYHGTNNYVDTTVVGGQIYYYTVEAGNYGLNTTQSTQVIANPTAPFVVNYRYIRWKGYGDQISATSRVVEIQVFDAGGNLTAGTLPISETVGATPSGAGQNVLTNGVTDSSLGSTEFRIYYYAGDSVVYDFTTGKDITQIKYWQYSVSTDLRQTKFSFEGSNNNINWTMLWDMSGNLQNQDPVAGWSKTDFAPDYTAPVTTISPTSTTQNTFPFTVTLTANESATTYYQVGTATQRTYTAPFSLTQTTDGINSVTIPFKYWSVDTFNNTETQNNITYDTTGAIAGKPSPTVTNGNNQVVLNWTATTNTNTYTIYRSQTNGVLGSVISQSQSVNNYTDDTVTNGQTYYYTVKAENYGNSTNSDQVIGLPTTGIVSPSVRYVRFRLYGDEVSATSRVTELKVFEVGTGTNLLAGLSPIGVGTDTTTQGGYGGAVAPATAPTSLAVMTDNNTTSTPVAGSTGFPFWYFCGSKITYDLGSNKQINNATVWFFSNLSTDMRQPRFYIEGSTDKVNWTMLADKSTNTVEQSTNAGIQTTLETDIPKKTFTKVKIYTGANTTTVTMRELQVFNDAGTNIVAGITPVLTAGNTPTSGTYASLTDGNTTTNSLSWTSKAIGTIEVTFASPQTVKEVKLICSASATQTINMNLWDGTAWCNFNNPKATATTISWTEMA